LPGSPPGSGQKYGLHIFVIPLAIVMIIGGLLAGGIFTIVFLPLAAPIAEHEPHLVVHGHAHAGTFQGAIEEVPICNVSVPVIERDVLDLRAGSPDPARARSPLRDGCGGPRCSGPNRPDDG
jgi:hypothetical protein